MTDEAAATRREVVVTGLGAVSPIGSGVAAFWQALLAARDAVAPISLFDASRYRNAVAQTVRDQPRGPDDPAVAFALRAADEALRQAGLDAEQRAACGLAIATTAAGWTAGQGAFDATRRGFEPPISSPEDLLQAGVPYSLATRLDLGGPCVLLSPACAAASSAIAWAAQRIRDGDCDVMLAGATDALTEVVFAGFHALRLLAPDACRPFSAGRRGLVLSEGAAFLVLESAAHAGARGATALARLSGWGPSCDASHPTTPASDGISRAMTLALVDAGLRPCDVDQVSAHGTGSPANDAAEARGIAGLLGERAADVPVTAIKGTLGHTEGAAGAFAALAAVLSLTDDKLPPLRGFCAPDPALPSLRLNTGSAEAYAGRNVLVNASGFGGANACLVFEKPAAEHATVPRTTYRAVVTGSVALTRRDGTLPDPDETLHWPGAALPLDRISGLVLSAGRRLLGPSSSLEIDPAAAVVLGTSYGSQARHERIWAALATEGPRGIDPNDFALSTFNAPGAALASDQGYGGANLVFLGAGSGAAALDEAVRQIGSGRARSVIAGGYDEVTPYYRRILAQLGETDADDAVCLLSLQDESASREHAAPALATILGYAGRGPTARWPEAPDFAASLRAALARAGVEAGDAAAVVLDPHLQAREPQLDAIEALLGEDVTLVDPAQRCGNCLAASAPLALHCAIEAAHNGRWRDGDVLRGPAALDPGRLVLINAAGLLSGCSTLVVLPHGL